MTQKFKFTSPDGKEYTVTAPDGATEAEAFQMLQGQIPQTPKESPSRGVLSGVLSEVMKGMTQGGPPVAMARGAYAAIPPLMDLQNKVIGNAGYEAGGYATDLASKAGMGPGAAGTAGVLANMGVQAIPAVLGGYAAKPLVAPMKSGAQSLMQQSLKPVLEDLKTGDAFIAINTLLERGISPTRAGIAKLRDQINKLNFQVKSAIANSTETVNKAEVGKVLLQEFNKFRNQVNPNADLEVIKKAWLEFRNHPLLAGKTDFPVQIAQDLKVGTNQIISKKYGQIGTADDAAQKALVRGLKEQISKKVPAVAGMNDELSRLYATEGVAERRALQEGNKNIAGFSPLAPTNTRLLAMLADSYGLSKSYLARLLYSSADEVTSAGRMTGLLYGTSQKKQHGH